MRSQRLVMYAYGFLAAGILASPAYAGPSSNFDTGNEGWAVGDIFSNTATAPDPGNPPVFNATGGSPGGYISTFDTQNIVAFLAPGAYTGNISSYYGGSLTFNLQDTAGSDGVNYPLLVLYSGGQSISYSGPPPATTWTSYTVPLTAAGWTYYPGNENNGSVPVTTAAFQSILANVDNFAIEADWHTGGDNTGLDTVSLNAAATPPAGAPAPLAGAGLLSFFGAGGVAMRKRAKRLIASLLSRRLAAA